MEDADGKRGPGRDGNRCSGAALYDCGSVSEQLQRAKPQCRDVKSISRSTVRTPCNEFPSVALLNRFHQEIFMRSVLLWLIGIPLPIIIILWLLTGHA